MKLLSLFLLAALPGALVAEKPDGHFEIIYEVFSLPIVKAAQLKRENLGGEKSYESLVAGVEKGEVKLEKFVAMRMIEGQQGSVEELEEFIFPTEHVWDGFMVDQKGQLIGPAGLPFAVSPIPLPIQFSTFDTKNIGDVIECEVNESTSGVEIRMNSTSVGFLKLDSFGEGVSEWKMPRFSVQRLRTGVEVISGKPALVGTVSPPRDLQKEKGGKRVWLAFVTLKKIKE